MDKAISSADARRTFSQLLRGVREGRSYLITAHDKPIARLMPAGTPDRTMARARSILMKRLRSQQSTDIAKWRREELYG